MIDLYRKKVFSTRACWWYPDSFFQRSCAGRGFAAAIYAPTPPRAVGNNKVAPTSIDTNAEPTSRGTDATLEGILALIT